MKERHDRLHPERPQHIQKALYPVNLLSWSWFVFQWGCWWDHNQKSAILVRIPVKFTIFIFSQIHLILPSSHLPPVMLSGQSGLFNRSNCLTVQENEHTESISWSLLYQACLFSDYSLFYGRNNDLLQDVIASFSDDIPLFSNSVSVHLFLDAQSRRVVFGHFYEGFGAGVYLCSCGMNNLSSESRV